MIFRGGREFVQQFPYIHDIIVEMLEEVIQVQTDDIETIHDILFQKILAAGYFDLIQYYEIYVDFFEDDLVISLIPMEAVE